MALQTMVDRLIEDRRRAQLLAEKISDIPVISLEPSIIETNMVFFRLEWDGLSTLDFLASCCSGACVWVRSVKASFAPSFTISSVMMMSTRQQTPFDQFCRRSRDDRGQRLLWEERATAIAPSLVPVHKQLFSECSRIVCMLNPCCLSVCSGTKRADRGREDWLAALRAWGSGQRPPACH
ncbi:hypothetical protein NKI25_35380 [Mesorhizobium sp. M0808]|uniref:hypothetical protein n=1 Tax=Mesorhizobium sp. M0808 TaxID=2957002 RepID=UPI00333DB726